MVYDVVTLRCFHKTGHRGWHFFSQSPVFKRQRDKLFKNLHKLFDDSVTISLHLLLYGDVEMSVSQHEALFDAVQLYITDTKQFQC